MSTEKPGNHGILQPKLHQVPKWEIPAQAIEPQRLGADVGSNSRKAQTRLTGGSRVGNRSALEWVIDQYQISTDNRSGIINDPNREDDPEYIVRLIGQVISVSLETVRLVRELSTLAIQ